MTRGNLQRQLAQTSDDPTLEVSLTVNGERVERVVSVRMLLSDFLRHELRLTGTHVGCEHGICGCCTVLIDGKSGRSCLTLVAQAQGAEVTHHRSAGRAGRRSSCHPAGVQGMPCAAVRLLHAGNDHEHIRALQRAASA